MKFLFLRQRSLVHAAQHFRDAPSLGDAAARHEGRVGVEHLADRADAGFGEMRLEAGEETPSRRAIIGVKPGIDERMNGPTRNQGRFPAQIS